MHGSAFEFFRNDAFNANDYFLKQQGQPRPRAEEDQYGIIWAGRWSKTNLLLSLLSGTGEANGTDPNSSMSSLNIPAPHQRPVNGYADRVRDFAGHCNALRQRAGQGAGRGS